MDRPAPSSSRCLALISRRNLPVSDRNSHIPVPRSSNPARPVIFEGFFSNLTFSRCRRDGAETPIEQIPEGNDRSHRPKFCLNAPIRGVMWSTVLEGRRPECGRLSGSASQPWTERPYVSAAGATVRTSTNRRSPDRPQKKIPYFESPSITQPSPAILAIARVSTARRSVPAGNASCSSTVPSMSLTTSQRAILRLASGS